MQTILGIGFVFLCAAVIIGVAYLYIRFYLFRGAKITQTSHNDAQITDDDFDELAPTNIYRRCNRNNRNGRISQQDCLKLK